MTEARTVALIGLGSMEAGMAENLLASGFCMRGRDTLTPTKQPEQRA